MLVSRFIGTSRAMKWITEKEEPPDSRNAAPIGHYMRSNRSAHRNAAKEETLRLLAPASFFHNSLVTIDYMLGAIWFASEAPSSFCVREVELHCKETLSS